LTVSPWMYRVTATQRDVLC